MARLTGSKPPVKRLGKRVTKRVAKRTPELVATQVQQRVVTPAITKLPTIYNIDKTRAERSADMALAISAARAALVSADNADAVAAIAASKLASAADSIGATLASVAAAGDIDVDADAMPAPTTTTSIIQPMATSTSTSMATSIIQPPAIIQPTSMSTSMSTTAASALAAAAAAAASAELAAVSALAPSSFMPIFEKSTAPLTPPTIIEKMYVVFSDRERDHIVRCHRTAIMLRNNKNAAVVMMIMAQDAVNKSIQSNKSPTTSNLSVLKFAMFLVLETRNRCKAEFSPDSIFSDWERISFRRQKLSRMNVPVTIKQLADVNVMKRSISDEMERVTKSQLEWYHSVTRLMNRIPLPDVYVDLLEQDDDDNWIIKSGWDKKRRIVSMLSAINANEKWIEFVWPRSEEWELIRHSNRADWINAKLLIERNRPENARHSGHPYSSIERTWLVRWIESRPLMVTPLPHTLSMEDGVRYNIMTEQFMADMRMDIRERKRELGCYGFVRQHRDAFTKVFATWL